MLQEATTSIGVLGDLPYGTHFCYFYESKQDLLDALVPFFQAGLDNGDFCLWVVYSPLREADALDALRHSIPGLDDYLAKEAIEILVSKEPLFEGDVLKGHSTVRFLRDKLDDALTRGYAGMRVAGSPACIQKADPGHFQEIRARTRQVGCGSQLDRVVLLSASPIERGGNTGCGADSSVRSCPARKVVERSWETSEIKPPRAEVPSIPLQVLRQPETGRRIHPTRWMGSKIAFSEQDRLFQNGRRSLRRTGGSAWLNESFHASGLGIAFDVAAHGDRVCPHRSSTSGNRDGQAAAGPESFSALAIRLGRRRIGWVPVRWHIRNHSPRDRNLTGYRALFHSAGRQYPNGPNGSKAGQTSHPGRGRLVGGSGWRGLRHQFHLGEAGSAFGLGNLTRNPILA